ncbi:unnamed protein product [Orchesella dallaii]|uniref:Secreted protein n=1 Tax=Orchesella dallaii TaxID=48710 RepID=A0ABP1R419_9HEXA
MNTGIVVVSFLVMLLCGSIGALPTRMPKSSNVQSNRPPKMSSFNAIAGIDQLANHRHQDHATLVENIINVSKGLPPVPLVPEA